MTYIKNLIKTATLALLTIALAGCFATIPPIVKTDYKFVAPPPELFTECEITPFVDPQLYSLSTLNQKEALLVNYSDKLLSSLAVCNEQLKSASRWVIEQEKIYNGKR